MESFLHDKICAHMDAIDCNIGQKCYLEIKGLTNNEFYGWNFHRVFSGAFGQKCYLEIKGLTNNEFYGWTFHRVFLGAFVVVIVLGKKQVCP
jgi:hypothetical protein